MPATQAAVPSSFMQEPMQEKNTNVLVQDVTQPTESSIKRKATAVDQSSKKSAKQNARQAKFELKKSDRTSRRRKPSVSSSVKGKSAENHPQRVQQEDGSSESPAGSYWHPQRFFATPVKPEIERPRGPSFQRLNKISEDQGAPTDPPAPTTDQPSEYPVSEKKTRATKHKGVKGAYQVRRNIDRYLSWFFSSLASIQCIR